MNSRPDWLTWARELQAIAQTGIHFSKNVYDTERYEQMRALSARIMASYSGVPAEKVETLFRGETGYATPKVDVRGAIFKDGQVLLTQELIDGGRWTLPGGWADVGDVPSQAAEREVLEESGYIVRASRVIGIYDANRSGPLELFHAFKLVFLCDSLGGAPTPGMETSAVEFFSIDELPERLSGERTMPRHIQHAFACLNDPDLRTVFD